MFVAKLELDSVFLRLQADFTFPFPDRVERPAFECLRVITPNLDVTSDGFQESRRATLGFQVLEWNTES